MGPTSRLLRSPRNLKRVMWIEQPVCSTPFFGCWSLILSSLVPKLSMKLRYGIAPKGKFFVADEGGVSMAPFFALTLQEESANWG
ncbi:caffeic acid 3-O-methyltransferase-like [Dorcoceras hygrometricum]|uniref:Caffeic acid 3-O-methyltransferase-like n=1 Tax=Dorcoceras hygrometricum TaxID=472368 RepID=A0A2Z6ZYA5_9LAMI|nr:caffeic acid 3-O-methyltransferase-like [Dorcoceras hygrometricum]